MNDTEIAGDLAFGAYASLPYLQQSANPDVRRYADFAREVANAAIIFTLFFEALKWATVICLVPYWYGGLGLLIATGITGLPFCLLVLFGAVVVPVLTINRNPVVHTLARLLVVGVAVYGCFDLGSVL